MFATYKNFETDIVLELLTLDWTVQKERKKRKTKKGGNEKRREKQRK